MKSLKKIFRISLILIITFCFTSCSWGILLAVGNNLNRDIKIVYKIDETHFSNKPKSYVFDKNVLNTYKSNKQKRPVEIPNDAEYNDELKTVTLTIKPGEASIIGGYGSFESFEEEIIKSELKVIIDKDSIINPKDAIKLFRYWNRKTNLMEIK